MGSSSHVLRDEMPSRTRVKQVSDINSGARLAIVEIEASPAMPQSNAWESLLEEISHRPKRVTERKQDRSRRTEIQILNAALRVFARDGISRTRIADIAAEAGISTSTLYEYYKSKEDLAYDVPTSHMAAFFEAYRSAVTGKSSARERLSLYLTLSADYAREHSNWARLLYLEIWPSVFVIETEFRHSLNDYVKVITHLLRDGIAEGWVRRDRHINETAAMLTGSMNQTIITWLLYRTPRNLTKAGAEMADRLIAMLELEAKKRP
jgi:AcrR family transcriptional regulator